MELKTHHFPRKTETNSICIQNLKKKGDLIDVLRIKF